jgi:hypothetical protein
MNAPALRPQASNRIMKLDLTTLPAGRTVEIIDSERNSHYITVTERIKTLPNNQVSGVSIMSPGLISDRFVKHPDDTITDRYIQVGQPYKTQGFKEVRITSIVLTQPLPRI